jgi:hypothetical protein
MKESDWQVFLDDRGHGKYGAVPYLDKANQFEGKCKRCKEFGEVWKIYSYMDRQFLDLCSLDIYRFIELGILGVQKSGKVWSRNPDALIKPKSKSKFWTSKYFCEKCQSSQWHSGYSEYIGDGNGEFVGNCDECGNPKHGETLKLRSEMKSRLENIRNSQINQIQIKNDEANKEYAELSLKRLFLKNSIKKNLKSTNDLYCLKCLKLTTQSSNQETNLTSTGVLKCGNCGSDRLIDPQVLVEQSEEKNERSFKFYCNLCQAIQWHIGVLEPKNDVKFDFIGNCTECGNKESGDFQNLKDFLGSKMKEIEKEIEIAAEARSKKAAEEYFDSAIQLIKEKRKRK